MVMDWTAPTYAEIKMDAEIGSYQEDTDPTREGPHFAGLSSRALEQAPAVDASVAAG
jgi:hypothetical protein